MGHSDMVIDLLEQIVLGNELRKETAGQLESAILQQFPGADDDERFEDLMLILASYNPEGGEYLYDGPALIKECRHVLTLLKTSLDK